MVVGAPLEKSWWQVTFTIKLTCMTKLPSTEGVRTYAITQGVVYVAAGRVALLHFLQGCENHKIHSPCLINDGEMAEIDVVAQGPFSTHWPTVAGHVRGKQHHL